MRSENGCYRLLSSTAKAADKDANSAGPDRIGLLGRLKVRLGRLAGIGNEVDRLGGDEGATLETGQPVEYECDEPAEDIDCLAQFPQAATARDLGISVRGWRNLLKGVSQPRYGTAERIRQLATDYRELHARLT